MPTNQPVKGDEYAACAVMCWLKATPLATPVRRRSWSGFGTVSDRGPLQQQHVGFAGFEFRGRRSVLAKISWQAQHFHKVKYRFRGKRGIFFFLHRRIANPIGTQGGACRFRGRGNIFARSGTYFVAEAAFSQGQAQMSWQGQHFRRVCRPHVLMALKSMMFFFLLGMSIKLKTARVSRSAQPSAQPLWDCKQQSWSSGGSGMDRFWRC